MKLLRISLAVSLAALSLSAAAQSNGTKVYIVQLNDAPVATFAGNSAAGLAATKTAPGVRLNAASANVLKYRSFLAGQQNKVLAKVGSPRPIHSYSVTFNGFAASLTDAQAKALMGSANVASVRESQLIKADTTRTPGFLQLTAPGGLWSQLDAAARQIKGEDVIIGVIDTGVWPENASFGDKEDLNKKPVPYYQSGNPVYGPPPAKWKGICEIGEGFTASMCNYKLIGARSYGEAWLEGAANSGGKYWLHPRLEYKSPRDGAGHGTHTASTSGGNANVQAAANGAPIGAISGIAPRARIAVYKALWTAQNTAGNTDNDGGTTADILKAIDQAVADGVDVINYSVSGSQTNIADDVEIAYLNATAAGVFVAASAGNSGPANKVAHISPWLMTVAASTHDRYTIADVTLGSGASFSGPSAQGSGVASTALVRSIDVIKGDYASLPQAEKEAAERCYLPANGGTANTMIDPAKAGGKMVICYRGGNVLVDKAAAVKAAGGAAMIIQNVPKIGDTPASANTTLLQPYVVPTVHLTNSTYAAINNYVLAQGNAATASFGPGVQATGVVAPVMASFSSRGPNKGNGNILKPDITGPGVDILAGYIDDTQTQIEHDGTIAGTFTPRPNAASLQGTSMSSPHVAGAAALLRQAHPTWSVAAIKSALMTSTTGVKLASGAPDLDRWGYGAGHMNPNGATATPLVYDSGPADHGRFLCGIGLTPPAGIGKCSDLGSIQPWNLNLASLTATDVVGARTLTRKVTNVSNATKTFNATASLPGWTVQVTPSTLNLAPGASGTFTTTLTLNTGSPVNTWSFGSLSWSDGVTQVTSPLSAKAAGFLAPVEVLDVRASGSGSKVLSVVSAYTGPLGVAAVGLVPATRNNSSIASGARQCFNVAVPTGAVQARFQLFDADTSAKSDLDLEVYNGLNGTGTLVGSSGGATADELVVLNAPAAGNYSACAIGYTVPAGGVTYALSSWVLGPVTGAQTLRASAPASVYQGGSASIGLGWKVAPGHRYLGQVEFLDTRSSPAVSLGKTAVMVDNR
ncbi:S8 family serine peptidase [Roseateles albus]|uniref:S8 family serine peptidase n=1 Tax=Roseateles albus TaxID=2987525 RepID=A0ABT5K8E9_9BURK|nr:S8 family serine peptidase [Roseateles albus]MDC8770226.1 S8 family serine peptidase [Roseateles albus]